MLVLLLLDLDEFDRRRELPAYGNILIFLTIEVVRVGENTYVEARPQLAPAREIWPSVGWC